MAIIESGFTWLLPHMYIIDWIILHKKTILRYLLFLTTIPFYRSIIQQDRAAMFSIVIE